jgi:hypothetical protein
VCVVRCVRGLFILLPFLIIRFELIFVNYSDLGEYFCSVSLAIMSIFNKIFHKSTKQKQPLQDEQNENMFDVRLIFNF